MILVRVARRRHGRSAFTGEGARRFPGRWNEAGTPMVYTSQSLSLAVLETLVHATQDILLVPHVWFEVTVPDDVGMRVLDRADLPRGWDSCPALPSTQALGSRWADSGETVLLSVPSAVLPSERNYLISPRHRDFRRLRISKPRPLAFDPRLA